MDSLPILIAVAAAFLLAGVVKGVIGLGLPTVAIGLLGLVMSPAQAAAILIVPSLVTNFWQMLAGGNFLELTQRLWPMLAGICAGTFFGAVWLPHSGGGQATMWLGAALVVYAALGLFKVHFSVPPRAEVWLGLIIGFATGAVTVATGVFAVPGVPYIQALRMDRDKLVQALGMEWLFRVLQEPRRLWRRYYETNTAYAGLLWREYRRHRAQGERQKIAG